MKPPPCTDGQGTHPGGGSLALYIPETLLEGATDEQLRSLSIIQVEYAREVTMVQTRAYEAVLKVVQARE